MFMTHLGKEIKMKWFMSLNFIQFTIQFNSIFRFTHLHIYTFICFYRLLTYLGYLQKVLQDISQKCIFIHFTLRRRANIQYRSIRTYPFMVIPWYIRVRPIHIRGSGSRRCIGGITWLLEPLEWWGKYMRLQDEYKMQFPVKGIGLHVIIEVWTYHQIWHDIRMSVFKEIQQRKSKSF